MRGCTKCGVFKAEEQFYRSGKWLEGACKDCRRAQSQAWRDRNPEKWRQIARDWRTNNPEKYRRSMRANVLKAYGMTPEEYEQQVATQGGQCPICLRTDRELIVDHCHETDQRRGLLCRQCNTGIGQLGDDPSRLLRALDYLLAARAPALRL